jgi:hypothetical protein
MLFGPEFASAERRRLYGDIGGWPSKDEKGTVSGVLSISVKQCGYYLPALV